MKPKRKEAAPTTAASEKQEVSHVAKKARASETSTYENDQSAPELSDIDVQGFLLRDCRALSKQLVEQAKLRAEDLRKELEKGKKVLLDAVEAEKENVGKGAEAAGSLIPRAFTITIRCITGPYRGRKFSVDIDVKRHSSCFVGRSTGRKFCPPRGLSVPKDSELSTSHGEIKMEATGKVFFIDLDSTNGSRIDDVELEAHEPYELNLSKPIKVEVGAGEYEFVFEQKT